MVPSEKVPVAVSCAVVPFAIEGFAGVTAIEVRTAEVTVTVLAPDTPPRVAVIVALPTPIPVTRPWLPGASLTVASDGAEETQVTNAVRFWVVPSEKSPVAMSCSLVPVGDCGIGWRDRDPGQYCGCDRDGSRTRHPRLSRGNSRAPHSRPCDQPAAANRRYGVRGRGPARRSGEILSALV